MIKKRELEQESLNKKLEAVRLALNLKSQAGEFLLTNPTQESLGLYQKTVANYDMAQKAHYIAWLAYVSSMPTLTLEADDTPEVVALVNGVKYITTRAKAPSVFASSVIDSLSCEEECHLFSRDKNACIAGKMLSDRCEGHNFSDGVDRVWKKVVQ